MSQLVMFAFCFVADGLLASLLPWAVPHEDEEGMQLLFHKGTCGSSSMSFVIVEDLPGSNQVPHVTQLSSLLY